MQMGNGAWQRTGDDDRFYYDGEERPPDPTLETTHDDLDHTWRSATRTRWGPGQKAPEGSSH